MLIVEMRTLEKGDVLIERSGPPGSLGIDHMPSAVTGSLELHCQVTLLDEYVLANGWAKGTLRLTCDRCLKDFARDFRTCLEIRFQKGPEPASEEPVVETDAELAYFEGDQVDLGDEIRQMLELSVPMRSVCRADCKGLCGGCGVDLNLEGCRCSDPAPDSRWSALKGWKPD